MSEMARPDDAGGGPLIHFGGPDREPRLLRSLLRARIDAVPAGGEIVWSTYYFRDRDLAGALMAASDRGARICLHIEGCPRRQDVNRQVIAMLRAHGLRGGLHVHLPWSGPLKGLHPHLHSKIYCFSHPAPAVLVGSFNPSGDIPEDQDILDEIGDQDRGHNLLVEFSEAAIVGALRAHVLGLGRALLRFRLDQNRIVAGRQTAAWFYPRLRAGIIDRHLRALKPGAHITGAISHLKHGFLANGLMRAAQKGISVRLLVHDTERRVPSSIIDRLMHAGVDIARYAHPERLPLHAKFLLIEEENRRTSYFGSFNYNPRSRYLNHEILVGSTNGSLFDSLSARFEEIALAAGNHS